MFNYLLVKLFDKHIAYTQEQKRYIDNFELMWAKVPVSPKGDRSRRTFEKEKKLRWEGNV